MKVTIGLAIGVGKMECEDSAFFNDFLVSEKISEHENSALHCIGVADGVGGNAGGKNASSFVASQITHADFICMTEAQIRKFVENMNLELMHYAATIPGKAEMATTLTCVVAASDGFYLIHSGNTRMYVMQGSYLKQMTVDQTTYNWLINCGQYEAAEQCNKSEITGCLGGGKTKYAESVVVQKMFDNVLPDTMVLTSDGIHEFVDIDTLENVLVSTESDREAIQILMEKAAENGCMDDKTIMIARR